MRFWFKALPLTLGMFFSVLAVLWAADAVRAFYVDSDLWEDPLFYLEDNVEAFASLGFSFLCALIGFPLGLSGVRRLTTEAEG